MECLNPNKCEKGKMVLFFSTSRIDNALPVTPRCDFCAYYPPIDDQPEIVKQLLLERLPDVKQAIKEFEKFKKENNYET